MAICLDKFVFCRGRPSV